MWFIIRDMMFYWALLLLMICRSCFPVVDIIGFWISRNNCKTTVIPRNSKTGNVKRWFNTGKHILHIDIIKMDHVVLLPSGFSRFLQFCKILWTRIKAHFTYVRSLRIPFMFIFQRFFLWSVRSAAAVRGGILWVFCYTETHGALTWHAWFHKTQTLQKKHVSVLWRFGIRSLLIGLYSAHWAAKRIAIGW